MAASAGTAGGGPTADEGAEHWHVLVVCTGNICRSPAIAALLTADAAAYGMAPARWLQVRTAGVAAVPDVPVHRHTARALAALGVPVDDIPPARALTAADVRWADLVLTATRDHRAAAVRAHPASVGRAFTLLELTQLLAPLTQGPGRDTAVGAPSAAGGLVPASVWPALAHELVDTARARRGLTRPADPAAWDLPDPIAGPASAHDAMVRAADAAVREVLRALLALGARTAAPPAASAGPVASR